jgi:hypothetical protein
MCLQQGIQLVAVALLGCSKAVSIFSVILHVAELLKGLCVGVRCCTQTQQLSNSSSSGQAICNIPDVVTSTKDVTMKPIKGQRLQKVSF